MEILKTILDNMTIADFNIEFDQHGALSEHEMKLPESVSAYRALMNASLGEDHEKLLKATVRDI